MVPAAGVNHLRERGDAGGTRLLAEDVFPGFGSPENPFLAASRRQRNINRVHIFAGEQVVVPIEHLWDRVEGRLLLTLGDKLPATIRGSTGDGDQRRVARQVNGFVVLAGDFRGAQDTPA